MEIISTSHLHETDFYAWTQEQVNLLKTQQWNKLDTLNLIEEIEPLGRKEFKTIFKSVFSGCLRTRFSFSN